MRKVAKVWGGALGFVINMDDRRGYGIEEGDILDITINKVIKAKKKG